MEMYELLQFSSGFCLTQFVCRLRSANFLENGGGMCDAACCVVSFRLQKYTPKNLNFLLAMQTGPGISISIPVDVPRQNFHHFCFFRISTAPKPYQQLSSVNSCIFFMPVLESGYHAQAAGRRRIYSMEIKLFEEKKIKIYDVSNLNEQTLHSLILLE